MSAELNDLLPPYRNIHVQHRDEVGGDPLMAAATDFVEDYPARGFRSASGHLRLRHVRRIREGVGGLRSFTFLRDPVDRVVSEFRYTRTPAHPTHEQVRAQYPNIHAFVEDPANQNRMWAFLTPPAWEVGDASVERIFQQHVFIGTLETISVDFPFLTGLFGCPRAMSVRANTTTQSDYNEVELDHALVEFIRERNPADVMLYDAVRDVLAKREREMVTHISARRATYGAGPIDVSA